DDAHEHVERVLDIVSLFNIPGVTHDAVMLHVFPITLTGTAKRWVGRLSPRTVETWDLLKKPLSKGIVHHPRPLRSLKKSTTSSRKVMKHYTMLGKVFGEMVTSYKKQVGASANLEEIQEQNTQPSEHTGERHNEAEHV
ncbi:hypothetical protein Tco_0050902, partial [Tanacetum coccineum]